MTPYELAIKDSIKARRNLLNAQNKPNVTREELQSLAEQVRLRERLVEAASLSPACTERR